MGRTASGTHRGAGRYLERRSEDEKMAGTGLGGPDRPFAEAWRRRPAGLAHTGAVPSVLQVHKAGHSQMERSKEGNSGTTP